MFAGIVDGDSAWATPTGVGVAGAAGRRSSGVLLELEYRPDLLKGAVTGSITGTDLGPITNPDAYGTSILIDTTTGATIGFQMISPIVAQPIPFSAPFDTSTIDPTATYVARGSVWDGTTLWNTPTGHRGHHQGQPEVGHRPDGRAGGDHGAAGRRPGSHVAAVDPAADRRRHRRSPCSCGGARARSRSRRTGRRPRLRRRARHAAAAAGR